MAASQHENWIDRYNAWPAWARVLLFPFFFLALLLGGIAGCLFFAWAILILVPWSLLNAWWTDFGFRRRMVRTGRVATWAEVEPLLLSNRGSLIVEVYDKGPKYGWWLDEYVPDSPAVRLADYNYQQHRLLIIEESYRDWHADLIERYGETANVVLELPKELLMSERIPADRVLAVLGPFVR